MENVLSFGTRIKLLLKEESIISRATRNSGVCELNVFRERYHQYRSTSYPHKFEVWSHDFGQHSRVFDIDVRSDTIASLACLAAAFNIRRSLGEAVSDPN
jgi:hypothetical protein